MKNQETKYTLISCLLILIGTALLLSTRDSHAREGFNILIGSSMFLGTGLLGLILSIKSMIRLR